MKSVEPQLEPIAIVGMACRFAGGIDSLEKFWELLRSGGDAIGDLPDGRWDSYGAAGRDFAAAVRDVTKRGAFLDDIAGFDADFFDITPREAALMDPQQRIVLELAWEALEHAGIPPRALGGTDTGVFMGVGSDDYGRRLLEDLPTIEAWTGIGGAVCAVSNRVSYVMDLRGPSMSVDTACSSSLVSIHLAAQALRNGECPVALAGGVLVMTAPGLSMVLDAAGATSPDGRSKSFDASADGYGRGEGAGVIVLKRLSDACRDGDRVLAVLRGSAVHQDGKTAGIMAPNGEAQAHLMRRAYEQAGIDPLSVGYVEAHGTGTRVGDPLEAGAMASVFGPGRPAGAPCLIGSVKPNIGHLEAGAGVAGVIKTVLALQHGEVPPHANFSTPNPAIDWANAGIEVATETVPWPSIDGPRRAGVSGYGYGGTLAHVILEQGDATDSAGDETGGLFMLSGGSEAAVRDNAARLAAALVADTDLSTVDIGHTLAHRREHLSHRAAVVAGDRAELVERLTELAEAGTGSATGSVLATGHAGLAMVFSGHGSQWIGMARELLDSDPVFTNVIDELEPIFLDELGISPRSTILDDTPQPVDVIQPMIFAVQVGLAALWRANGVTPDAVVGHSVGEIAAAVTAGVFTVEQGARLVCRRSALLRKVVGQGAMAMVNLPPEQVADRLGDRRDVALAVAAATGSSVVSGDIDAIAAISEEWLAEGLMVRKVDSDVAFHSPQMEPLLDELAEAVADLTPAVPIIPVYSTALVDPRADDPRDGEYWATNLGGQVRFAGAVTAAVEDGYRLFLEVSPHPVVEHSINETLEDVGVEDAFVTHTLRRNKPERDTFLANLGLLYCHGVELDLAGLWPVGTLVDLPTIAWQHKAFWADEPTARSGLAEGHDVASHTLLGSRIVVHGSTPARAWLTRLDYECRPYPGDHPVREVEIIPAAVLLNTFLSTSPEWVELTDVALRVPVSVTNPRDLQVVLQDGTVRLSSRVVDADGENDKGWVTHTTAVVQPPSPEADEMLQVVAGEALPTNYVIERLATLGVAAMGFPWVVEDMRRGEGTLAAVVRADPETDGPPSTWASILDAALSIASVAFSGPPTLRMPAHIHRVALRHESPSIARIVVRVIGDHTVEVQIQELDGTVVGGFGRLRYGVLGNDVAAVTNPKQLVHEISWRPVPTSDLPSTQRLVLVGPDTALLGRLTERFGDSGVPFRTATDPAELRADELGNDHAIVVVPALAPAGGVADAAADASWLLARTAQRLAGAGLANPARLWCVTQGVRDSVDERSLGHGLLWGLGRIVGGEHPELWGGTVDIGQSHKDIPGLIEVLRSVRGEDVVVVRDGVAEVPRLTLLDGDPVQQPMVCQPDGTYLITGGLGVLGRATAHYLADRGARRIVLAGRTAMPSRDTWAEQTSRPVLAQIDAIQTLERLGVTVTTVAVDISDPADVAARLTPGALGLPAIKGVVHAAGVLDNQMLSTLDEESLRTVLRPKVNGALALHAMFPPGSVDFFVLFSSCGQLLGLPGQASYAAGNAFLDALAAHRRAAGDKATMSLGWTSWRGLGMSTSSEVIDIELNARGTADISVAEALDSWELAERYNLGYAAVLRTLPLEPGERRPALLSLLPSQAATDEPVAEAPSAGWLSLAGAELHSHLSDEIRAQVAKETKLAVSEVDPRRALVEMGIDSVMNVRIRRALEKRFRIPLPATLFWDRPTIDAVAGLLVERIEADRINPAA